MTLIPLEHKARYKVAILLKSFIDINIVFLFNLLNIHSKMIAFVEKDKEMITGSFDVS